MKFFLSPDKFIDTDEPLDISLQLENSDQNVRAWYVDPPVFEPVRANGFVGSVVEGGGVNFRNVFFNPHGHGTHTECLGHITEEIYSVNDTLKKYFFQAQLISIQPKEIATSHGEVDLVISADQLKNAIKDTTTEALIIRTLPNSLEKKSKNYSATNPTYLDIECIEPIRMAGVQHLLIDTPSVDREEDGGKLAFHHAYWEVPENPQYQKTITELIFVDDSIPDGNYVLELQVAAFKNDASPSRPILYKIRKG